MNFLFLLAALAAGSVSAAHDKSNRSQMPEKDLPAECQGFAAKKAALDSQLSKARKDEEIEKVYRGILELYHSCNAALFAACFPKLQPTIDEDKLGNLFAEWSVDPTFHMQSPEVFCYSRAYLLSEKLVRMGYEAKLLNIAYSPSLIGVAKDASGVPKGFYDYHGTHWVVQIQAKTPAGDKSMVLDPQFMDKPTERSAYFKAVTGRDCISGKRKSIWDCDYTVYPPNHLYTQGELRFHDPRQLLSSCGWSLSSEEKKRVDEWNRRSVSTARPIPKELKTDGTLTLALLRAAYEARLGALKQEVAETKTSLAEIQAKGDKKSKPLFPGDTSDDTSREKVYLEKLPGLESDLKIGPEVIQGLGK